MLLKVVEFNPIMARNVKIRNGTVHELCDRMRISVSLDLINSTLDLTRNVIYTSSSLHHVRLSENKSKEEKLNCI
jgi:hypothetical protein